MKTKVFLLTLMLSSCGDNSVRFEVPQPEGQTNEKSIPKKLFGEYSGLGDSSSLIVTPNQIIKTRTSNTVGLRADLDSAERLTFNRDTAFSTSETNVIDRVNMKIEITVRGDSIFTHMVYKDTIFNASGGDVLRKFRGHYFINRRTSKDSWQATKLTRTKIGLALGTVSSKEDIQNLRLLTENASDTIYNFNPTRKQFKKFLKTKGFGNEQFYVKIDK